MSGFHCLRKQERILSAEYIASKNCFGNAIGGLSVGEPAEEMYAMTEVVCNILPEDKVINRSTEDGKIESIEWKEFPQIIIITDSESSISTIANFQNKTQSEKQKTTDRDIIIDCISQVKRIEKEGLKVWMLQIPAHTNDTGKTKSKEKLQKDKSRLETFYEKVRNKEIADQMIEGNKRADEAATAGRKMRQIIRNFDDNPTETTDEFFLFEMQNKRSNKENGEKNTVNAIMTGIHKTIKKQAAKKAKERRKENPRKRGQYLKFLEDCDVKRTFVQNSSIKDYSRVPFFLQPHHNPTP